MQSRCFHATLVWIVNAAIGPPVLRGVWIDVQPRNGVTSKWVDIHWGNL